MRDLDHAQNEIEDLLKRRLKINPGLESVMRHPEYSAMIGHVSSGMQKQVKDLLHSDMFKDIDTALGAVKKDVRIFSESDELEIYDAVVNNIDPLTKKLADGFADFLILIFNMGGQDFLNTQNIPATFNLTNEAIINRVKSSGAKTIKDLDDTTVKWVKDQIVAGRKAGMDNSDIADSIREKVPETYDGRADRIVRTETSSMVGEAEHETAGRNGASHKEWVVVPDDNVCEICIGNESAGTIGYDQQFPSGDLMEPAHPNCRCLVQYTFTPFMGSVWSGQ